MSVTIETIVKTHCFMLSNKFEGGKPIFVQSDKFDFGNTVSLLGALDFKFEDLVDMQRAMSTKAVADILVRFFDFKYVPENQLNVIQKAIPTEFNPTNYSWAAHFHMNELAVIAIDRHYAREYCCRLNYIELMSDYVPYDLELFKAIQQAEQA